MQHIAPIVKISTDHFHRQDLVGPGTGIDSCTIAYLTLPQGYANALATNDVDTFYYCLEGGVDVQFGADSFTIEPHTMAFVPAEVAHRISVSGSQSATCLEIFAPSPTTASIEADKAQSIPNAAAHISSLRQEAFASYMRANGDGTIEGFGLQKLASRETGSMRMNINVAEVQPDSGGPQLHIHPFDQFYFVMSGALDIQIGVKRHTAPTNSLVVLPAGVVHANWNGGTETEMHLAIMTPSLPPGERGSFPVEIPHAVVTDAV